VVRAPTRIHYRNYISFPSKLKKPDATVSLDAAKDAFARGGFNEILKVLNDMDRDDDPAKKNGSQMKVLRDDDLDIDPKVVWEDALSEASASPGMVIAVADYLFEKGKYRHAAELLKANLRLGITIRPWVYESLAVALEACHAPREEVRRARLSALALEPRGSLGYLQAAESMADMEEWQSALSYCRQAAQLAPNTSRPYVDGLAYAEKLNDAAGLEWAARNLLSQDWPIDNVGLQKSAQATLHSLAADFEKQKRQADAERVRNAVQELRERDLVIKVSWLGVQDSKEGTTGADYELEVKEPNGFVCSSQQRQSTGGGIYLGNTVQELNHATYVAAKAFSGEYDVTVRRLWGEALEGKVKIEVIMHQGTAKEERWQPKRVQVNGKYSFRLAVSEGRRSQMAAVPPPSMQQELNPKKALPHSIRILNLLREIADNDFTPTAAGMQGGMGAPAAARTQPIEITGKHQSEKLSYNAAVQSMGGGGSFTAQVNVSTDKQSLKVSLIPNFRTVAQPTSAAIDIPLIPGGSRQ
jgi:hypothetical protein